ncbi:hypothetical protein TIFTF001_053167 [Ficus carica]|uniref:Uncharacterized protein n=1 Tax=Ficus carica TaxID=3494 RepID=A0AA88EJ82_FICCA|nr:hypothetical protein TIFTF001_053164 [Ficus carica]GMN74518.1 hypothetical protein TIFTF001_053165 [Ficus carica]GMN74521.1 hypothetical protein TIFTF001_053166 [Ficus carica]GMN74524.1 hypothetical protein TIFTF001_053167 [Ficus carica]
MSGGHAPVTEKTLQWRRRANHFCSRSGFLLRRRDPLQRPPDSRSLIFRCDLGLSEVMTTTMYGLSNDSKASNKEATDSEATSAMAKLQVRRRSCSCDGKVAMTTVTTW